MYASPDVRHAARLFADLPLPGRGLPIGSVFNQFAAAHVSLLTLSTTGQGVICARRAVVDTPATCVCSATSARLRAAPGAAVAD